jgi:hypothetical protein
MVIVSWMRNMACRIIQDILCVDILGSFPYPLPTTDNKFLLGYSMRFIRFLIMNLSRWTHFGRKETSGQNQCGNCEHFNNDPVMLEEYFKGIGIFSSVRGCSRGDAGICSIQSRYLLPVHSCSDFVQKRHTL